MEKYIGLLLLIVIFSCKKQQEKLPDNVFYTCSMDPQVMDKKPGKCPVCKMELTKITVDPSQKGIKLSEEQMQLANVEIAKVELGMIGTEKVLAATVVINENLKSSISSRMGGRIENLYFKNTGEKIEKGQVLYQIYSEELLTAERDYLSALEQQKQSSDYTGIEAAAKNKLLLWGLTEKQIEKLRNEKSPSSILPIFSKTKGIITSVEVREGDYVMEGATIFEIADFSTVWIEAQIYSNEVANILAFQDVSARILAFPKSNISGRFSFINPQLLSQSKISLARMEISNPEGRYKPGMQAYITLLENRHQGLYIDPNAVLLDAKGATVWVRNPDGSFINKMVRTGVQSADKIEITRGLEQGDEVVISGAYLINSEYIFKKGANPMDGPEMKDMKM
jgi:Cu(I)/Ag(I) efflux system membrane fusion protein